MLIQYRVFAVQKYAGDTYSIENEIKIYIYFCNWPWFLTWVHKVK